MCRVKFRLPRTKETLHVNQQKAELNLAGTDHLYSLKKYRSSYPDRTCNIRCRLIDYGEVWLPGGPSYTGIKRMKYG
ncbi:hypothetical protein WAE58_04720 [Pedobacter panaciterrae]|uniref:Uncharacterized protein n=1 Tax=Pedobacter panaciterrae TaxID=363849 RepID=A0ABU8NJ58_9SPHI